MRAGRASTHEVLATLRPGGSSFASYNFVAEQLVAIGETEQARGLLMDTLELYRAFPLWKAQASQRHTWQLLVTIEAEESCARAADALRRAEGELPSVEELEAELASRCPRPAETF
jgi:hypothetical protein